MNNVVHSFFIDCFSVHFSNLVGTPSTPLPAIVQNTFMFALMLVVSMVWTCDTICKALNHQTIKNVTKQCQTVGVVQMLNKSSTK